MTAEAGLISCCCAQEDCCPISAYTLSLGTVTLDFDFVDPSGTRIYTTQNPTSSAPTQAPITLGATWTQPLIMQLIQTNPGPLRCSFVGSRPVSSGTWLWNGSVVQIIGGTRSVLASGQATGIGPALRTWIHAFKWFEHPWFWEMGIWAGQIGLGMIASGTASGCPPAGWSSGNSSYSGTRYRGCFRRLNTGSTVSPGFLGYPSNPSPDPSYPYPPTSFPFSLT